MSICPICLRFGGHQAWCWQSSLTVEQAIATLTPRSGGPPFEHGPHWDAVEERYLHEDEL